MPSIKQVGTRVEVSIDTFDGGRNTKDAPSRIADEQSPDLLNVVFDDVGAAGTREGTSYFNTSTAEVGTNVIDGQHVYDGSMVIWAGGQMLRASGTTFVPVTSSSGQFSSGVKVGYITYQDIMFCSDGVNGPYRWEGNEDFYNMGIGTPTAPTAASDTAGDIAADTYYYAVTFTNSHAVEGGIGAASAGTTIAASSTIQVTGIETGTGLEGVGERDIYRATSATGPWLFVKNLADNVTTSFTDTVGVGAEGGNPPSDATAPTPFQAITLHRERLLFPDNANKTLLRYTDFNTPFISAAANFEPLNKGDSANILALNVQQNLVTAFKDGTGNVTSTWVVDLVDPSDDTTWVYEKLPINVGIAGLRAHAEVDNGLIFLGARNGKITGFHYLSGVELFETNNRLLRTRSISENIETDIKPLSASLWADAAIAVFNNAIHIAGPYDSSSTSNEAVWWFDLDRLGDDGQPGSWSVWTGVVDVNDFTIYQNGLYGGASDTSGYVLQFYNGTFTDADGTGIDSYFWTKEFGGEPSIESWIKDMRWANIWYALLGSYNMNVRWRKDGDQGAGNFTALDLTPPGDTWGNFLWGVGMWSAGGVRKESQISVGSLLGRRFQLRFENERPGGVVTPGSGFKVFSMKMLMNLRRQLGNVA